MKGSALIEGRTVCVVDGVSVRDGSMDKKENVGAILKQAETAVGLSSNGFLQLFLLFSNTVLDSRSKRRQPSA
jgi:hypothetical protein